MSTDATLTSALHKVMRRLLPFLMLLLLFNLLDRTNISFAALQMNADFGFTPSVYGLAAGIFFIGYFLFEVPSNLMLVRVGARPWLARIMISWGLVVIAMAWVRGAASFYTLRFLLGVAEAGLSGLRSPAPSRQRRSGNASTPRPHSARASSTVGY